MLLASVQQDVAIVVAVLLTLGWGVYLLGYARRTRPEVGSEIELAPNRKPYLDDEHLEGPKLERALTWGLLSLVVIGVGLPLYWLAEPGRQEGAVKGFDEKFEHRGAALFETTANGGFNCAGCHGGMQAVGQKVPHTLADPETGDLRQVQWTAPALNDVLLRMSEDQVRYVLTYGRPFSPMPAWGLEGGGPMNEQQLDNLIAYLRSIQITKEEAKEQAEEQAGTDGEALFDAYCARCHTQGWSYDEPLDPGSGAFGPNLRGGATRRQFPTIEDHVAWVTDGVAEGEQYGLNGISTGRMPYFRDMLTEEQILAIVEYERSL
jgi:mono/diheme cytochrome c family protein